MTEEQKDQMKGHRQRVREKVARDGLSTLPDYQILEFLLFYGVPRKDTKKIAYRLLHKFGNIAKVLEAPVEELIETPDMTYNAAVLLHALSGVFSSYKNALLDGAKISSPKQVVPFIRSIAPLERETMFMLCLDDKNVFICMEELFEGEDRIRSITSEVLLHAVRNKAKKVMLVHNHPSGMFVPSKADVSSSLMTKDLFASVGITMLDHVVITADKAYSIFLNREI